MKLNLIKIKLIHPNNVRGSNDDREINIYTGGKPAKILKKEEIQKTTAREIQTLGTQGYGVSTEKNITMF